MSRKMKILFTVSIILNVLLLGTHGGMAFKKWHRWQSHVSQLSPEGQNIVARDFQDSRQAVKEKFETMRAARKNVTKVLRAKEFDEQAFQQASSELQAAMQTMMNSKLEMMKELSLQLTPEDRAKLSMRMLKPHGGKKHHKKERKDDQ